MQLQVSERLILLNIIPGEGDITTLRIIQQLRTDLSFSEDEHKALEFQVGEGGAVHWKTDADVGKDVEIGEKAHDIIKSRLEELSNQKKLQLQHMALYERFVEGKEPELALDGQKDQAIPDKVPASP